MFHDNWPYSATSVAKIIKRSAEKAGIKKRVIAHPLPRNFAAHLLQHRTIYRVFFVGT